VESLKRLQEGEQWAALVDYTILAWGYVQVTGLAITKLDICVVVSA
jgi:hypothetical protein